MSAQLTYSIFQVLTFQSVHPDCTKYEHCLVLKKRIRLIQLVLLLFQHPDGGGELGQNISLGICPLYTIHITLLCPAVLGFTLLYRYTLLCDIQTALLNVKVNWSA